MMSTRARVIDSLLVLNCGRRMEDKGGYIGETENGGYSRVDETRLIDNTKVDHLSDPSKILLEILICIYTPADIDISLRSPSTDINLKL
jgi:hypothetical protein